MDDFNNNNYQQPYNQTPYEVAQPVQETTELPPDAPSPKSVLVYGIISLAMCWWGISNIAGLILGVIGIKQSSKYYASGAPQSTMLKVGRILSIVGMAISIASIVFWFVGVCIYVGINGIYSVIFLNAMSQSADYSTYFII